MPNLFDAMRQRNIFQNIFNPAQDTPSPYDNVSFGPTDVPMPPPTPAQPKSDDLDIAARMKELYTPETAAVDRFNALAAAYPQFKEPGALRRIGGSILGALTDLGTNFGHTRTGVKGTNVFDEVSGRNKYLEDISDWQNQIKPAEQAANLERQNNANERTMAYQTVNQELTQKRDEDRSRAADEKNAILRLKTNNPNLKFDFKGPTVLVTDPATGKVSDTGVKTGHLSDADKLGLMQEGKIEQITTKGAEDRKTHESKGFQPFMMQDPNDPTKQIAARINLDTGAVEPITLNGQNTGPITKPGTPGKNTGQPTPEALQALQQKTRETLGVLDELQDAKTSKLTSRGSRSVGLSSYGNFIPTSEGYAGQKSIERLKSLLIVDLIAEMKNQSRTGATGFGQLNMKELGVLESAASKLDPKLDEKTFNDELTRIREKLNKVLQPLDGFTETKTTKPLNADEMIAKYSKGGKKP